jgi:hypothetical protein
MSLAPSIAVFEASAIRLIAFITQDLSSLQQFRQRLDWVSRRHLGPTGERTRLTGATWVSRDAGTSRHRRHLNLSRPRPSTSVTSTSVRRQAAGKISGTSAWVRRRHLNLSQASGTSTSVRHLRPSRSRSRVPRSNSRPSRSHSRVPRSNSRGPRSHSRVPRSNFRGPRSRYPGAPF